jgi:hypothetical protein
MKARPAGSKHVSGSGALDPGRHTGEELATVPPGQIFDFVDAKCPGIVPVRILHF